MSLTFEPVTTRPDPALLTAVGERLAELLASNRRLAQTPAINFHARRRIEAVIAGLIDALDHLQRGQSAGGKAVLQGAPAQRDAISSALSKPAWADKKSLNPSLICPNA